MFLRIILISLVVFVIGASFGVYVVGPWRSMNNDQVSSGVSGARVDKTSQNYQAGFADARKLVEDSSLGSFFRTEDDVRTVSGTVTAINGNRLTIQSQSANNPFDGSALKDRTILVDTNTKTIKLTDRDPATIKAEMEKKAEQSKSPQLPPVELYDQTTVDASSILVGDSIVVTASDNVKTLAEFTAEEIRIQPKMFIK